MLKSECEHTIIMILGQGPRLRPSLFLDQYLHFWIFPLGCLKFWAFRIELSEDDTFLAQKGRSGGQKSF